MAGLAGTTLVVVIGNLDGASQVIEGLWRAVTQGLSFWLPRGEFDFWRSSRMMPPGNEITEFPFFTFLFAMFTPAKKIANVNAEINRGIASAERVFDILDNQEMEVYDNQDKIKINQFNELEFKNVSFSYDNENNVLEDINIKIKKGDFIALVGESGSGKTTFSDLILNF